MMFPLAPTILEKQSARQPTDFLHLELVCLRHDSSLRHFQDLKHLESRVLAFLGAECSDRFRTRFERVERWSQLSILSRLSGRRRTPPRQAWPKYRAPGR